MLIDAPATAKSQESAARAPTTGLAAALPLASAVTTMEQQCDQSGGGVVDPGASAGPAAAR